MEENNRLRGDRIIRSSRFGWIRTMCVLVDRRYRRIVLKTTGWISRNEIRGKT